MIYRSKAPLRIGLAGGGTDVSPYSDLYGGAILNATISLYARAAIEPLDNGQVIFDAEDRGEQLTYPASMQLPIDGQLDILKGVANRVMKEYCQQPLSFRLTTFVDAPAGSGLGTSSTLVVAVLGAFVEWLKLPLGEYDIAQLAYGIEREDLQQAGGKQDQYAATFGGVNFMEFYDNRVIVNPLRIKDKYLYELENNLLLYYTSTSRLSSSIISEQQKNVSEKKDASIDAMHHLKEQAVMMKEALLRGEIHKIGEILDYGFQHKKQMAKGISNQQLDNLYEAARQAGASGGKISGAGGGGFMIFYCPGNTRFKVANTLKAHGGHLKRYHFTHHGLHTWSL
ncbi:D-glycero-alpha-D-manno-heptose-7-phosphate kinase [Chitinophaga costaii]|uniref:D-glycero-alpha-D-manno-heptose-7-phosphate kinase n=1 Tax=Chitinophaga costaii TaxID=1335309 RepID=A0A1C4CI56_9BACT|nr:dehydrogenase [Chitinophaga costaii]PUZ27083.1 dehydrogenase [Chitinophaga costaii]SCC18726.1 D-glycero-alpha-D-manno-heptose-7-phosphate kinase [Chitinophaga costaii]